MLVSCGATGSLFHQILDQRDLPNTSADSLGSELFDAGVMKDDDRHRCLSHSLFITLFMCNATNILFHTLER